MAGCRNAHQAIERWPEYVTALHPVADMLHNMYHAATQPGSAHGWAAQLHMGMGTTPARPPVCQDDPRVRHVATAVGRTLGVPEDEIHARHPASPWRASLVRAIAQHAQDPDTEVATWLSQGAPLGISRDIPPGGLLPAATTQGDLNAEYLADLPSWSSNHGSFEKAWLGDNGEKMHPALDQLEELVDEGFLELYSSQAEAEAAMGVALVPSPLGDVVKTREDGQVKHRLITDLAASRVNEAVAPGAAAFHRLGLGYGAGERGWPLLGAHP